LIECADILHHLMEIIQDVFRQWDCGAFLNLCSRGFVAMESGNLRWAAVIQYRLKNAEACSAIDRNQSKDCETKTGQDTYGSISDLCALDFPGVHPRIFC
jgi:hypothetical protein